jgi:hypothetical protein
MHKSPVRTSICALFFSSYKEKEKKRMSPAFSLVDYYWLIGVFVSWYVFFFIVFYSFSQIDFFSYPIEKKMYDLWDLSNALIWKKKYEIFSFREWCKLMSIVICIRPSFMRTWTPITQYDSYLQRYAQQQQQNIGRHPGVSKMRPEWVNVFLSLSLSRMTSILIKMTIITIFSNQD